MSHITEEDFLKQNDIIHYDYTLYHLIYVYIHRLRRKLRGKVILDDDERAFMNELYMLLASWLDRK